MRIISRKNLRAYAAKHPNTRASLAHWEMIAAAAVWRNMQDVMKSFPKASIINSERARFELAGNTHRMVASFYFPHRLAFIKFIGTHPEYDAITNITEVSMF